MVCTFCRSAMPEQTKGRPREYCDLECRRGAEALAILARVMPGRPGAVLSVMAAVESIPVDMTKLSDPEVRQLVLASARVYRTRRGRAARIALPRSEPTAGV